MPDTNARKLRRPSSISSGQQRRPNIDIANVEAASKGPAETSWTRLNTGQETSTSHLSTGSTGWPGQGRAPSRRQSQRGCLQMINSVPCSSAPETSRTGAISTSYSPPWLFSSHEGTPNFDRSLSCWRDRIQESRTSHCTTR